MKLIDEAIEAVSNAEMPLANAFIKAQIIAHKLQDKEFAQWVRSEIQGYPTRDSVPEYREVTFIPHGNLENMARRYNDMPLPIAGIPPEMRSKLLVSRFQQSIAVIEGFAQNSEKLMVNINQSLYRHLMHGIDPSYSIVNAWGVIPEGTFLQIINEARSRLLDLLLNLDDQIPAHVKEADLAAMPKISGLNEIFKGAVLGSGANINFAIGYGSQASNNSSSVTHNDIDSLLSELAKSKVPAHDLNALRSAIEDDAAKAGPSPHELGPTVRGWIASMVSKAGTAAWDVPFQTSAALLANAISKFYGI